MIQIAESTLRKHALAWSVIFVALMAYAAPYLLPVSPDSAVFRSGSLSALLLIACAYPIHHALSRFPLRELGYGILFAFIFSMCLGLGSELVVYDGLLPGWGSLIRRLAVPCMSTPFLAWIAMGVQGDGTHSADDNHYIWAQETHEEKVDGAKFLLKARLEYMGPAGYIKFLNAKAVRSFGSGNLDYPNTVSESPMKQNFMIDVLNPQGRYNAVFDNIIQGYHILIFLMLCVGAVSGVLGKDRRMFVWQVSSLGMLLFLLLWEAGTRYLLNYYPVFVSASLGGFVLVFDKIFDVKKADVLKREKQAVIN